ncbi:MAG: DUF4019 domain-containing protein, partial [Planctomycetes bacterium]|nr:DUF4019 domain-containing protein [Planctomycetota bacterium]
LLQIFYFYNPLLWLANAVIRRVREQAVDEAVQVAMGEKAEQYPETLVNVAKLAFKRPALSLRLIGVVESRSALKGRVKRMLNRPIPKSAKLGILGLLTVLIFGAVLLPMAKAKDSVQRIAGRQQKNQKSELVNSQPVVVRTMPAVFTDDVSPGLKSIKVMFDQPMMDLSWSWCGSGDTYPKTTGNPRYNQSKTTCSLPVDLEPGRVYWVGINSPSYKNFQTKARIPAAPYVILFATKGKDGKPTPIPQDLLDKAKAINEKAKQQSGNSEKTEVEGKGENEKSGQLQIIEDEELNLTITIPVGWQCYKNPAPGRYKFSWQLLPSKLKAWAMFIGSEFPQGGIPADTSVRQIAVGDVSALKGFFDVYNVRDDSWKEYVISEIPTVSYVADYKDKDKPMVEYRSYLLSESMVYWFVFRIEKDKFESAKSEFDSIVNSFKLSRTDKDEPVTKDLVPKEPIDSAKKWLKLIDDADYSKSWEKAAEYLKNVVGKEQFQKSVESVRRPLGKVISRKVKSKNYTRQLPGASDGEYVVLEFDTSFENKSAAIETVTPMLDKDGIWRVSGYYIK